jgi:hypothetical protein
MMMAYSYVAPGAPVDHHTPHGKFRSCHYQKSGPSPCRFLVLGPDETSADCHVLVALPYTTLAGTVGDGPWTPTGLREIIP